MSPFQNKICIVTGGGSGIGLALCEEMARRGATVIVADLNQQAAENVAATITAQGGRAEAVHLDVTHVEQVDKLVAQTVETYGRLDYMYNNAGIATVGEFYDLTLEDWQKIVDVNLWGVIYGTTAAYRVMKEQGYGHIINTASAAGLGLAPMSTAYSTTKTAVVALSNSLRFEAEELGVKVSVACPAFVATPIQQTTKLININKEAYQKQISTVKTMSAKECARIILDGVVQNKAVIAVGSQAKVSWWMARFFPGLTSQLMRKVVKVFRNNLASRTLQG